LKPPNFVFTINTEGKLDFMRNFRKTCFDCFYFLTGECEVLCQTFWQNA